MQKKKFLIIPFLAGLLLFVCSWYLSYPLSHNSSNDPIFSHLSILYWFSMALLLTSMYMIAVTFENKYLKWLMAVACFTVFYSLSYFYNTLPTSDANFFRGYNENFIISNTLNPQFRTYYQWPAFFILANVTSSISGLELINYEFLLFTILGILLSTVVYVYASKIDDRIGILTVVAFFVLSNSFLNYQVAPFTVAFCLLFILFALETQQRNTGTILAMLILYIALTMTHIFVPLFFVLYLLIKLIITRSRNDFSLLILTLVIYLLVQIAFAEFSFAGYLVQVFTTGSEFSAVVARTFTPLTGQIDIIAQMFSRIVTVAFGLLCFAGFVFSVIKRKLRDEDKTLFFTGVVYAGIGVIFLTLGTRAVPMILVPVSTGLIYIYRSRFKSYLKYLILILLIFVLFIPLHGNYLGYPKTFQTKEDIATANFMIEKYDWNSNNIVISDLGMKWYLAPVVNGFSKIDSNYENRFELANITNYDCVIYSLDLERGLQTSNISVSATSQQILNEYDVVFNSGFSYVAMKNK
jgi:hypothetical protein